MVRVWLSLGSNINREENIRSGITVLKNELGPLLLSSVYDSEAVGFDGDPFFNLVAGFETRQSLDQLFVLFRQIEAGHGRIRSRDGLSSRTLDIDILTYGDSVRTDGKIRLPRQEITRYAFVLRPMAEVAGSELHPLTGKSYRQLWDEFDQSSQKLRPATLRL